MCLLFAAYRQVPGWRLVVAANRDEHHARPAAPAAPWPQAPHVLAGRDLQGGGTWLGVARGARFGALTNFREGAPRMPQAPSRGALVSDFLLGTKTAAAHGAEVAARGERYNGFNLLLDDGSELVYLSNRDGGGVRSLAPGLYGLSNHLLDTPWPKVRRGRALFAAALRDGLPAPDRLLALMDDRIAAEAAALPATGIPAERERTLSPMFIAAPLYGTRCITVLALDGAGAGWFAERSYDAQGEPLQTRCFDLPAAVAAA